MGWCRWVKEVRVFAIFIFAFASFSYLFWLSLTCFACVIFEYHMTLSELPLIPFGLKKVKDIKLWIQWHRLGVLGNVLWMNGHFWSLVCVSVMRCSCHSHTHLCRIWNHLEIPTQSASAPEMWDRTQPQIWNCV